MPPERTRRQDPVSCENCRKKKLKCDRGLPCANCRSRDSSCLYSSQRPPTTVNVSSARTSSSSSSSSPASSASLYGLRAENSAIRARLRALEELVLPRQPVERPSPPHPEVSPAAPESPATTVHFPTPESESVKALTGDSRWLEGVGSLDNTRSPALVNPVIIRIAPLSEIINLSSSTASRGSRILIPAQEEARAIFQFYMEKVDVLQHVLHLPTVATMFERVYSQLQNGEPYRLSETALVIAIMASIAGHWGFGEASHSIFDTPRIAIDIAVYWLRCALDVLEQSWRSQSPELVTVQATIILVFLLWHTEAYSPKTRFLHATAITLAKDIGLHTTDSAMVGDNVQQSREQIIEKEMRRRVWYHLVATDWSFSLCGGPHEGTYLINPTQMRVRKPRNIFDEDMNTMPADYSRPLSEVTTMSYYLFRIRLGEVCREVADITWELAGAGVGAISYESTIVPIDKKFDDLLAGLPPQLNLSSPPENLATAPKLITMQRYFTNLMVHARRCKLHLPFLVRAAQDERFAFSRSTCLQAARKMLTFRNCIPHTRTDESAEAINVRFVGVIHQFFMAIVVLVMDICVNRAAGHEEERKAEIQTACIILEDSKRYSSSAELFLDALTAVMRKHQMRLLSEGDDPASLPTLGGSAGSDFDVASSSRRDPLGGLQRPANADLALSSSNEMDFGDLWQGYFDMGADIDPQEWDAIFAQLESTIE